ncbi:mandelate racemase/muconate lactonizing enzyme family protein [Brevibacterium sp. CSND-B09]|uniref:mandelate racemase/muconate lactonizing enzyme family protein n=1 Tax=Brevibacterium sp. CSND-B09 TaxID=3462571 RepID=UPI00406A3C4B
MPKITAVRPVQVNRILYVSIETDDGLYGVGESGAWAYQEAAAEVVKTFADYLVGQDPRRIEHHWQFIYRAYHFRGAVIMGALSAIDIALWDLAGKRLGVPVHELLGGAARERVRVYKHVAGATVDELINDCKKAQNEGYTAVGHLSPFLDIDRGERLETSNAQYVSGAVSVLKTLRAEVGDGLDLCVELHRRLSISESVTFGQAVADVMPMFIEDPVRPDNLDSMALVASSVPVPVATGERLHTPEEFQMLLSRYPLAYTRISVCLAGGITGAMKIAAIAESVGSKVVPHNPLSPVSTAACLQVSSAVANLGIMELPDHSVASATERYTASNQSERQEFDQTAMLSPIPETVDGHVSVPTGSGIGIDLDFEIASRNPATRVETLSRLGADGAVVDQ